MSHIRIAITGGTSGLGRALVREFVNRDATVAFVARNVSEIPGAQGISGDISRKEQIHPVALQILAATGGGLDVLVNNASDLGPVPLALLADTECEDFERALGTNVLGPFRLTKALLGALAASAREGNNTLIVNISSDAALNPYPKWGAYGASKAALHHMSRIWDEEISNQGIRVLSLDPGDMDTPMHIAAIPNADRSALQRPETVARNLADMIMADRRALAKGAGR